MLRNLAISCLITFVTADYYLDDPLVIEGSGIYRVLQNSLGIIFYVAVYNKGCMKLETAVKMLKCVENLTNLESESAHISLVGGYSGILEPGRRRNLTLMYHNLFPYNRRGSCSVSVWFKADVGPPREQVVHIPFDTTLQKEAIPSVLRGFYELSEYTECRSVDQDPLNKCRPVDCARKYNGKKVFFSRRNNRCLPAPVCVTDQTKALPDVAYLPDVNLCSDLENPLGPSDVRFFTEKSNPNPGVPEPEGGKWLMCHNGRLNPDSGECECEPGWTSVGGPVRPTALPVHLCTIPTEDAPNFPVLAEEAVSDQEPYKFVEGVTSYLDDLNYTAPAALLYCTLVLLLSYWYTNEWLVPDLEILGGEQNPFSDREAKANVDKDTTCSTISDASVYKTNEMKNNNVQIEKRVTFKEELVEGTKARNRVYDMYAVEQDIDNSTETASVTMSALPTDLSSPISDSDTMN